MRMADIIAQRSPDPATQVGAIIVTRENVLVGAGYNAMPRGIDQNSLPWDKEGEFGQTKYEYVCHAEENAIYNANNSVKDGILYTTLFPCNECAKTIIQNGVKEVVFARWQDRPMFEVSKDLLQRAGVKCRQYMLL